MSDMSMCEPLCIIIIIIVIIITIICFSCPQDQVCCSSISMMPFQAVLSWLFLYHVRDCPTDCRSSLTYSLGPYRGHTAPVSSVNSAG